MRTNEIERTNREVIDVLSSWRNSILGYESRAALVAERDDNHAKLQGFGMAILAAFPERVYNPRASRAIVLNQGVYGEVPISRVVRVVRKGSDSRTVASDSPTGPNLALDLFDALAIPSEKIVGTGLALPQRAENIGAGTRTANPDWPHDVFVGIRRPESELWLGTLDSAKSPVHRDRISREALDEYFDTRAHTATLIVEALRQGELNPLPAGFAIPPELQAPPIEI